jgi:membrane fusion protein (multidrug efflux system)
VVGKKTVEVGQHVQPGEQLVAIVSLDDIWITADFKETQLRKIRTGQRVTIHVDATGGDYRGYVEGLAGASGEKYSLLPPENATGNYVKVVQRLPVRIRLFDGQDVDHRLRPGMSAEPSVWLR